MSSLIIKVTQNGTSQEYLFNRPGPIIIGTDKQCDLCLDDIHLEAKVLEVKVSCGNIFIKELGVRSRILLNSVILPFREETPYHEGEIVSLSNTHYQIQFHLAAEAVEPPPFFESDFKIKLEKMSHDLKHKEQEIKTASLMEDKRKKQLQELDGQCHQFKNEKKKLEIEVGSLTTIKECISSNIKQDEKNHNEQVEKSNLLKLHIERLEQEEMALKEKILATNHSLSRIIDERDAQNKDMDEQRRLFSKLNNDVALLKAQIADLSREKKEAELEINSDSLKLQATLKATENAVKERQKSEEACRKLLNEKTVLDIEVQKLQEAVHSLDELRISLSENLHEIKSETLLSESGLNELQEKLARLSSEKHHLVSLNTDLRNELDKAETKLRLKKDQWNQYDFQFQETTRKLTTANFDFERVSQHLKELLGEEDSQSKKILNLREEIKSLSVKAKNENDELMRSAEAERYELKANISLVEEELDFRSKELMVLENGHKAIALQYEQAEISFHSIMNQKKELEIEVSRLMSDKKLILQEQELLQKETLRLQHEKGNLETQLSILNIKALDRENAIKETEENAYHSLEEYKREERAKLLAEKEVLFTEIEAVKQKSLIDVDVSFRKQQNDLFNLKHAAQIEAENILKEARSIEEAITTEARSRLNHATNEAQDRETISHQRMKEAQEYLKQKEAEADAILQTSRLESRRLLKQADIELKEDIVRRKQKIKNFLSMKQEQGLLHLKVLEDQHSSRMKKDISRSHKQIEQLKRKELKKIANLREEELSRQKLIKADAFKEINDEQEKVRRQFLIMKNQQESELAETKKTVLEHLNHTKFLHQEAMELELRNTKLLFEQSKQKRIQNATQAVINVMVGEFGFSTDSDEKVHERIELTLKRAIDGQNAEALKQVGQILDMNPALHKKMFPMLKRYTLYFGFPAAMAIILLGDIGSVRTKLLDHSKHLLKLKNSASDIFVKQQKAAWKEKYTFKPQTTDEHKDTFTQNILYTTNFELLMDDEQFQNDWILGVHEFMVNELELSEDVAINYISSEGTLIKELVSLKNEINPQFLEQGLSKLNASEEIHLGWLKDKLKGPEQVQKFSEFRKTFFDKYSTQKLNASRDIASDPDSN